MSGGDSLQAQAMTLQTLRGFGKATGKEIAEVTGLSCSSTRRSLLALYRNEYVERSKNQLETGGREYMYWVSPNAPESPPTPLHKRSKIHTQAMILQAVVDAGAKVTSGTIAEATALTREAVQIHLRELSDNEVIYRRRAKGKRAFVYWIDAESPVIPQGVEDSDTLWWAPITRAAEQAQSQQWRGTKALVATPTHSLLTRFEQRRQAWTKQHRSSTS